MGLCESRLDQGADVLIINKFGKHEAEGRGFRSTIAKALVQGMPVLVGLNGLFEEATLCGGLSCFSAGAACRATRCIRGRLG